MKRCVDGLDGGDGKVDAETMKSVLSGIFHRNQRMGVDDHMAEEMECLLEAYGKVVFKVSEPNF